MSNALSASWGPDGVALSMPYLYTANTLKGVVHASNTFLCCLLHNDVLQKQFAFKRRMESRKEAWHLMLPAAEADTRQAGRKTLSHQGADTGSRVMWQKPRSTHHFCGAAMPSKQHASALKVQYISEGHAVSSALAGCPCITDSSADQLYCAASSPVPARYHHVQHKMLQAGQPQPSLALTTGQRYRHWSRREIELQAQSLQPGSRDETQVAHHDGLVMVLGVDALSASPLHGPLKLVLVQVDANDPAGTQSGLLQGPVSRQCISMHCTSGMDAGRHAKIATLAVKAWLG